MVVLEANVRQELVTHQVVDVLELFNGIVDQCLIALGAKSSHQACRLDITHRPDILAF